MDSEDDLNAYNPDQSLEERRQIQQGIRSLEKDMIENAEEYLQPGSRRVLDTLQRLEDYSKNIRQTNEAAIDSKALLTLSDLQHRKLQRLTAGTLGNGVDADEFLAKCITFMRGGTGVIPDDEHDDLTHMQRNRRRPARRIVVDPDDEDDDDDDDDEDGMGGDMLDWARLGRYACIPHVRRPPLPGFLLGPLSVEKKARKAIQRTAPLRVRDLQEVRPEVLDTKDLAKNQNELMTACSKIMKQLKRTKDSAFAELQRITDDDSMDGDDITEAMERLGIAESGNIDLVRFCLNPHSFGQTVENIFYVSFLIHEGMLEVRYEENGLPSICPSNASERGEISASAARHSLMKHQAIFSIDMASWRELITTFNIKKPMIEHRTEARGEGPGARGWYS